MSPDTKCNKKDKRVLVLLAFGCLFLLVNCHTVFSYGPALSQSLWLEICSKNEKKLYRIPENHWVLTEQLPAEIKTLVNKTRGLKHELISLKSTTNTKMLSIKQKDNEAQIVSPSPKLQYLLKQRLPVNVATAEDLTLIPGIGPGISKSIISYRQEHGLIVNQASLKKISGIGDKRSARMTPYMSFE